MPKLKTVRCFVTVEECAAFPGKPWIGEVFTYGPGGDHISSVSAQREAQQALEKLNGLSEVRHGQVTVSLQPINNFSKPSHKTNSTNNLKESTQEKTS